MKRKYLILLQFVVPSFTGPKVDPHLSPVLPNFYISVHFHNLSLLAKNMKFIESPSDKYKLKKQVQENKKFKKKALFKDIYKLF